MLHLRLLRAITTTPCRVGRGLGRTVFPVGLTGAVIGALFLIGCPKGNVAALSLSPHTPVVGETLTIVLVRETKGFYPAHAGRYTIVISRPPEITPENPTPSQPPDAGVKLGEVVLVNGHGEFQTVLQPTYGPDKYGTILTLEPGTQLDLRISGPNLSMKKGLLIAPDHPGEGLSPFKPTWDL